MRSKWQQTIRNSARNNLQFVPEIQQKINRNTPPKKNKKKTKKHATSSAAAKQLKSGNWMKRSSWRRTQRRRRRQLNWLVTHRFAVKSLKSLCCLGRLNLLSCVPLRPHSHLCGSSYTALPASASVSQFQFQFQLRKFFWRKKNVEAEAKAKAVKNVMNMNERLPSSLALLLCLLLTLSLSVSVCLSVLGFMRCTCIRHRYPSLREFATKRALKHTL